jgi:hypothetical protein
MPQRNRNRNIRQIIVNTKRANMPKKKNITPIGKLIRAAGAAGGSALGGYFGMPALAGAAGGQLGALASKWLGFGDYTVKQNSVLRSSMSVPSMHSTGQSITVRHKEFVGPIKSSINFTTQYSLPLNPALSGTFPWLSGVADRYQEYAFKGVVFHYIPASGNAISGTSPSLGTVMLQTSYRASDSAPINKIEMLNEYCASEAVPCEPFIHPIECDPRENPFNIHYCRSMSPPSGEPLMSYDLGRTFVATQGQLADGNVLGDLWVTYEVELKKPVVRTDVSSGGYWQASFTPASATNLFNGNPIAEIGTLDMGWTTDNTLILPETGGRNYLITLYFGSSTFSAFDWTKSLTFVNAVVSAVTASGSTGAYAKVVSGAGQGMIEILISKTDLSKTATVKFNSVSYTGTPGTLDVMVYALDVNLPA